MGEKFSIFRKYNSRDSTTHMRCVFYFLKAKWKIFLKQYKNDDFLSIQMRSNVSHSYFLFRL